MNLFDDTLLNDVFDSFANEITVNDNLVSAIISSSNLNAEIDTKHIHTIEKVRQGDIVIHEGSKYIIVTESISKRHNKYKNVMEHCNVTLNVAGETKRVVVDYDAMGRPIYDDVTTYINVPSVLLFDRVGSTENSGGFLTLNNTLKAKVQKSATNIQYLTVNKEIAIEGNTYKIIRVDKVQTGIMILQMEFTITA